MSFNEIVIVNLFVFYGSLSRPSAVQISCSHLGTVFKMPSTTRIARTCYLNLIYFCRKYIIFTKFYEFMLQKMLRFANYFVSFCSKFCSNCLRNTWRSSLEADWDKVHRQELISAREGSTGQKAMEKDCSWPMLLRMNEWRAKTNMTFIVVRVIPVFRMWLGSKILLSFYWQLSRKALVDPENKGSKRTFLCGESPHWQYQTLGGCKKNQTTSGISQTRFVRVMCEKTFPMVIAPLR